MTSSPLDLPRACERVFLVLPGVGDHILSGLTAVAPGLLRSVPGQ